MHEQETRDILDTIERERRLIEWQAETLPTFDPRWTDNMQRQWFAMFRALWRRVINWRYD